MDLDTPLADRPFNSYVDTDDEADEAADLEADEAAAEAYERMTLRERRGLADGPDDWEYAGR